MKKLKSSHKNFYNDLSVHLQKRSQINIPKIDNIVKKIIINVKKKGDKALFAYSKKFDDSSINESNILIPQKIRNLYKDKIDTHVLEAFKTSIKNVTNFQLT